MATSQVSGLTFNQAISTFDKAFNQLKASVSSADADIIKVTTLKDVMDAAIAIEARQRERRSMRTMARVKPILLVIDKYTKAIDIVCNGTLYLPWIWAPIKLMLQIASEVPGVLDTLLNAYSRIADVMPDFGRIGNAFQDSPSVREVLALIYEDILEFHRRAYKFLRRRAWHIFFEYLWKSFESGRFHGILVKLSNHRDLLMREIQIIDIIEAKKARDRDQEEVEEKERKKENTHLHDSISWLKIADEGQLDILDGLLEVRQEGTCEWVTRHPIFIAWKDDAHSQPVIWLNGIPGAGKTVLCSYVINSLREESQITAPFYICNSYTGGKNLLSEVLRSIVAQLLRANKELAPYTFEKYANSGLPPSISHLKNLLQDLLGTIPMVRMCIDGLDEFPDSDQRKIIQELSNLSKASQGQFRILFSSRDVALIERAMKARPQISLLTEEVAVKSDISAYVHERLVTIRDRFEDIFIAGIERQVVTKAKGMFLWVRLIVDNLYRCYNKRDLQNAVNELPDGLDEAYGRILKHVLAYLGTDSEKAIRIMEWAACSFRVLKVYEVLDGITFDRPNAVLDEDSKVIVKVLDLCKPLIQRTPNNTVEFVHYSAREYILHVTSGPFLDYSQAHFDIAFSCILYLNTSFCFYDTAFAEDNLKLRVLKGFHGLHHYANEFWFQHLLQHSKSNEGRRLSDEMNDAIGTLLKAWKKIPGIAAKELKLDDTTTKESIINEIQILEEEINPHAMGQDILTLRAFLAQEKYVHQEAEFLKDLEFKHDHTHFSDISQRYQDIVQSFINCDVNDLPPGSTPEILDEFRITYLDAAFICRYRNCPVFSEGFSTAAERNAHEKRHIKPLRCADPSCERFESGFSSRTGLVKHNRKYHPKLEEAEPPTFESIKIPKPIFTPQLPPARQPSPEPLLKIPNRSVMKVKQKRVSRARKGLPVHNCLFEGCYKVFTRAEGLRRHEVIHSDPTFLCHIPDCQKAFHRKDLLQRHLDRHANRAGGARTPDDSDDGTSDTEVSEDVSEPLSGMLFK